ncbi:LuxR C-terminal-related transcriptional regulator [Pseudobacter ginsenosidimutans]
MAEQLSISPKTVENHIGRAIRHLKDKMVFIFWFL